VRISVDKRRVLLGGRLKINGSVRGGITRGAHVRIMLKTRGAHQWRRLRRKLVNPDGSFATWPRYLRDVRAARRAGVHRYTLRGLHLSRHVHRIKLRAIVTHAGRSKVLKIRVRHKRAHRARHHR
jgi:hypothetical protein